MLNFQGARSATVALSQVASIVLGIGQLFDVLLTVVKVDQVQMEASHSVRRSQDATVHAAPDNQYCTISSGSYRHLILLLAMMLDTDGTLGEVRCSRAAHVQQR